ncbi:hypothetical protein CYMTET_34294 [Cymbomonas tetramitiformis]|uniref:Right handed beta helix domain-containing protein n=1 Tax=Cymbomonas tetramitiformis TaxID=36881 RepID=A0AAE0KQ01_9CHLO|nr:hypothetical protein CYMTET_34294 [Cymbomonas tetramitiformis]
MLLDAVPEVLHGIFAVTDAVALSQLAATCKSIRDEVKHFAQVKIRASHREGLLQVLGLGNKGDIEKLRWLEAGGLLDLQVDALTGSLLSGSPSRRETRTLIVDRTAPFGTGEVYTTIGAALLDTLPDAKYVILVRPGTYYEQVTLTPGVELAAVVPRTVTLCLPQYPVLEDTGNASPLLWCTHGVVRGLRLCSTRTNKEVRVKSVVQVQGGVADHMLIEDCVVEGEGAMTATGIQLWGSSRCTVFGVEIANVRIAIHVAAVRGTRMLVAQTLMHNIARTVVAQKCTFTTCCRAAVEAYAGPVNPQIAEDGTNLELTVCGISESKGHGVVLGEGVVANLHGNRISGVRGVEIFDSRTSVTLNNNQLQGCSSSSVFVHTGASATLETNRIEGAALSGVEAAGRGTRVEMRRNHVNNGTGVGVYVHDGAHLIARDNQITLNDRAGVEVTNNSHVELFDNHLAHNGGCIKAGRGAGNVLKQRNSTSCRYDGCPICYGGGGGEF